MTQPQLLSIPRVDLRSAQDARHLKPRMRVSQPVVDRPGWIPPQILSGWDENPYAYQTEEELMPAGGEHGQLLGYLMELLRDALQKRDLMLLLDVFMLYRDEQGVRQRIGPDLLLMPYQKPAPSAYDLDKQPPPLCVVEVTSPSSRLRDLKDKKTFYLGLGIPTYLVIDAIQSNGHPRPQANLYVWREVNGQAQEMSADSLGRYHLPEMGLAIQAVGDRLTFSDLATGETLFDVSQLLSALAEEREAKQRELDQLIRHIEQERLAKKRAQQREREAEQIARQAQQREREAEQIARQAQQREREAEQIARQAQQREREAEQVAHQAQQRERRLVKNLLAEGYTTAKIAELTGLSSAEIEQYRG